MEGISGTPEGEVGLTDNQNAVNDTPIVADVESDDVPSSNVPSESSKEVVEHVKGESARDTTKRVLEKLSSGSKETLPSNEQNQAPNDKSAKSPQEKKIDDLDPELLPPERLRAQERALFNNLPKGLKRGLHRVIKDLEAGSSRIVTEHQKETNEVRHFRETIAPFASRWAEQKVGWIEGTLSLARAQEKLTNPETSLPSYVQLGVDLGHIKPEEAQALMAKNTNGNARQPAEDSRVTTLQQRLDALELEREQQRIQQSAQPIVEDMRAVKEEVNPATGQYRYPELHNGDYLLSLRPRIEALRGNDPTLGYGEALRIANDQHKQEVFGYTSQTAAPSSINRPLANTSNDISQRAAQAAVTVRGKTFPTSHGSLDFGEPPPEALRRNDARATAQWAYEKLSRG